MYFSSHHFRLQCLTFFSTLSFAYLMIQDGKNKGDESVFCKYNIFYKNNKLPRKLCLFLMILASVVSALRIVMLLVTGQ